MNKRPSKLREQKKESQEAYEDAIRSGKIKPEIIHEHPSGIVPCVDKSRNSPNFSFL